MSCEKTTGHSFSLIHHPAQAGSSCLRRGNGDATQIYQFNYDGFDNTTSVGIGAHNDTNAITLMTYAYGERGEEEANIVNGLLTSQTYGNGDKVSLGTEGRFCCPLGFRRVIQHEGTGEPSPCPPGKKLIAQTGIGAVLNLIIDLLRAGLEHIIE